MAVLSTWIISIVLIGRKRREKRGEEKRLAVLFVEYLFGS
jgi:hypothetical protein